MTSLIQRQRQGLHAQPDSRFIEPADFISRATSRQSFLRADVTEAAVRGLFDPTTGTRFFVEDEKLTAWHDQA